MSRREPQFFCGVVKPGAFYGPTCGALAEVSARPIYTLERRAPKECVFCGIVTKDGTLVRWAPLKKP